METVLSILALPLLLAIVANPFGIFAMLIASGSGKSESEDQAQYERFNPRVKPVQEVHRKEPTPLPTKDSALVTLDGPEKLVQSLMERRAYYCFESQSVERTDERFRFFVLGKIRHGGLSCRTEERLRRRIAFCRDTGKETLDRVEPGNCPVGVK